MNEQLPEESVIKNLELEVTRLIRGAEQVLYQYMPGKISVSYKGKQNSDPVTEADIRIEDYLRKEISQEYPQHLIIAEESSQQNTKEDSPFTWVIDPLDGTANFASGIPVYAISIGILYEGIPIVGGLLLPSTSSNHGVYHASLGGGAFWEDQPITASLSTFPISSGVSGVPANFERLFSSKVLSKQGIREIRVLGSIAYEMTLVAKGAFQSSFFNGGRIWDVAAGIILISEAGGGVWEFNQGSWRKFSRFNDATILSDKSRYETLRSWNRPLLTGGSAIAEALASRITFRRSKLSSVLRKLKIMP